MGFTLMGVLKNTGYKNGKWRDVSWYEKQLNPYPEHPVPFRKIDELYRKKKILDDYLLKNADNHPIRRLIQMIIPVF